VDSEDKTDFFSYSDNHTDEGFVQKPNELLVKEEDYAS
jgi:hypothetical protein